MPMSHVNSLCGEAIATCITLVAIAGSFSCAAADISVMVVDRDGRGVAEVVVAAMPVANLPVANLPAAATHTADAIAIPPPSRRPAVMDQRNREFVPRVLVVGVGTSVEFPNNDSVSHQVYSFSAAKRFQLPLYKGESHPPVTFDKPGLVVLGCNIHDAMVGYIYVTAAPYFGTTEATGAATLKDLPAGDYQIVVWGPYVADAPGSLVRTVHVDGNEPATARFQLSLVLRARPEPRPHRRDWEY
jgi:plastocyanin